MTPNPKTTPSPQERVERLSESVPSLADLVGESELEERLDLWEHALSRDRDFLYDPQPGYSRTFWNTLLVASEHPSPRQARTLDELRLLDAGLRCASSINKAPGYRKWLVEEDGRRYFDGLAELAVISRLAPLAASYDLGVPGSDPKKNYDLHLEISNNVEFHVDVKYRHETPLGSPPTQLYRLLRKRALPLLAEGGVLVALQSHGLNGAECNAIVDRGKSPES